MDFAKTHKFVAVINKNIEIGIALNAIAHATAGLVNIATEKARKEMSFIDFTDKDENIHKSISALSLIVLRAKSGEIKKLRRNFEEAEISFVDFLNTMTGDTYKEQLEKTANTNFDDLDFYGIVAFGEKTKIDPLTKKLSLWK